MRCGFNQMCVNHGCNAVCQAVSNTRVCVDARVCACVCVCEDACVCVGSHSFVKKVFKQKFHMELFVYFECKFFSLDA